jgi:hypothetical protein
MADKKISALTGATTPLAGTEVLPIVQGGATVKVSVDNLTVGRDVTAKSLKVTLGNLNDTVNLTNANGAFGNWTALGAGLLIQQKLSAPYECVMQTANAANSFQFPLSLNPSGGDVSIGSNLVVGTSGKGIDFSATSGSGTSELFADYEEGTWTATDQSGASLVLTSTFCQYTKVGNLVTVSGFISYPVTASASAAIIGGLPFTASASQQSAINVWNSAALNLYGYIDASTQRIIFRDNTNTGVTNVSLSNKFVCFTAAYTV